MWTFFIGAAAKSVADLDPNQVKIVAWCDKYVNFKLADEYVTLKSDFETMVILWSK